jgi:DNA mismatch repair protein MutS
VKKAAKTKKPTPLMVQYFELKSKYSDAILLFRVGDFYETFGEDAIKASKALGIILTKRNNGGSKIELAGFPYHSLDLYLPRLVKAGFRVAICEQLEKPSKEKKIVKRGVTDVVTPGVTLNDKLLNHKENNFLCSIHIEKNDFYGISFLDISTGEFYVAEGNAELIKKLVNSFTPAEILVSKAKKNLYHDLFQDQYYCYQLEEWIYQTDFTREKILNQFGVLTLKGFGIETLEAAQIAAGSILHYLESTEKNHLDHITKINRIQAEDFMWLDSFTIRNLELVYSQHHTGSSLTDIIDRTTTPMGARMLKQWILMPLLSTNKIKARHKAVAHFKTHIELSDEVESYLKKIGDLERMVSKIATGRIHPKEVIALRNAAECFQVIKDLLRHSENEELILLADQINPSEKLILKIKEALQEDPPVNVLKGNCIQEGYNSELDDLRNTINNSKQLLTDIQVAEAEKTGIANLKIGFNNVFGYYLEVTNKYKNKDLIPENWVRKQTLTNAERYITDELKKLETKILNAQDLIQNLESSLYNELVVFLGGYMESIQLNAHLLAKIDCLLSFGKLAYKHDYCEPEINNSLVIDIKQGRHPVIEQQMKLGENYVPNDLFLSNEEQQIIMITGPNMSGKSAVLRQSALIVLLAQAGSFVPAKSASIGIVDKLFTRVGASDNISSGESTFMVEMNETSNIMNNITDRSLILLDEIGRGTSTYDGISIAWSIAEYLHENEAARPKTLFATHYHELNELANQYPRIKNFNVSTKETGNTVIFLRKLVPGGSLHSFGIHVAKLAGMPVEILRRAAEILTELEKKSVGNGSKEKLNIPSPPAQQFQLQMFSYDDPKHKEIADALDTLDVNAMTPVECMLKLIELKEKMKET